MSGIRMRLRALFRRDTLERELDEELRHHIELETEAGLAEGLTPEEARRRALVKFGGVERHREATRDEHGVRWLDDLKRDVRFAFRSLGKSPGFTTAAVLTLALGIGANTAIFSVVDGVLLRPIPFEDPDELVVVWETDRASGTIREPGAFPDYEDFRRLSDQLASLGAMFAPSATVSPESDTPRRADALWVTPSLLETLGVEPVVGRLFTEADVEAGSRLVLLGEEYWRGLYGGDPDVVGGTLRVNDQAFTIVGVLPGTADFGIRQVLGQAAYARGWAGNGRRAVDIWFTQRLVEGLLVRNTHPFMMLGRLAPGATVATADTELSSIAAELEAQYASNDERGARVEALADVVFGPSRPALFLLLGAVALVLLVACANVANLLLARGTARSRETAVRTALGAGGGRLARQFAAESVVLVAVSASAGVALAYGGLELLLTLAPAELPRLDTVAVDGRVLLATLGVSGLVALAFGLVPLAQARRLDVRGTLADGGRGARGGAGRLRSALVVAEMALAVTLVSGAGLLLKSFWSIQQVDPGYDAEQVLKADYTLPLSRYPQDYSVWPEWPAHQAFIAAVTGALEAAPGVESVALAGSHPVDPGFTNSWAVVGREAEAGDWPEIRIRVVDPGYLETVGLPLVGGRNIQASDDAVSPRVAMVNRTTVDRFFPSGDPVGQSVIMWGRTWRVVGVVGDERIQGVTEAAPPALYVPMAQAPSSGGSILVRTSGEPVALADAVRRAVWDHDPELAVFGVEPLAETLSASLAERRFTVLLLGLFAALALGLMVVGVHGVLSYTVARQMPELGIRIALGADRRRIVGMVVRRGLALGVTGIALGLAGALAGSRLLAGLLYQVSTRDPGTLAVVVGLVLASALTATYLPARRATAADPMQALRAE